MQQKIIICKRSKKVYITKKFTINNNSLFNDNKTFVITILFVNGFCFFKFIFLTAKHFIYITLFSILNATNVDYFCEFVDENNETIKNINAKVTYFDNKFGKNFANQ